MEQDIEQEQLALPVIYQDHHLLILNKPAGLVVHPTYKHASGTMWDGVLAYLAQQGSDGWSPPDLPDDPGWERAPLQVREMLRAKRLAKYISEEGWQARPTLLHRLDKDTSGVIALARTAHACAHVARQFTAHTIVKTYLAVARQASPDWSRPRTTFTATFEPAPTGESTQLPWPLDLPRYAHGQIVLDGPLQRDPADRRRCIVGPDGQESRTRIRLLAQQNDLFLLEARPITGRTHQIRAHLAAAGYALVGDALYAPEPEAATPAAELSRQFLHAFSLQLRDYPANHLRTFVAPLPSDLVDWLQRYFPAAQDSIEQLLTRPVLP